MFSRQVVLSLAGARSLERGEDYAFEGRVTKIARDAGSAKGIVQGSLPYRVRIWCEDGEPHFSCTCPVGVGGSFCKHAVALALVATGPEALEEVDEEPIDLGAHLRGLPHERLGELVLELADTNELAWARLRLEAARGASGPVPLRAFTEAIDEAFASGGFVPYLEAQAYAEGVGVVVDSLRELLHAGHAEAVITLTEHALREAEGALGSIDDSDGHLGGIAEELQALHLKACTRARPDPVQLAGRLFEWELHGGDLDVFYGAAMTYARVLGKKGLAAYQGMAEAAWERLPALAPGDSHSYDQERWRITQMMESLAEARGDVDSVVAVLARDLSSPYAFVRISERLSAAGRHAEALGWAERGLASFGVTADPRLVAAASEGHQQAGDGERAVELNWQVFDARPDPGNYRLLATRATRAGSWPAWRPRALERLRTNVTERSRAARQQGSLSTWAPRADASDLVEVFMFEGDVEQAWAEAEAGGCSPKLWLEFARKREREHPPDAIPIFEQEVERLIGAKRNDAYQEAVAMMAHIGKLMRAAAQPEAFPPYAAGVRERHRAKRNLVKLLDARRW